MSDLEIAKTELFEENLALSVVKNGSALFSTRSHRISGLIEAIEKLGGKLVGSSMADRVVGKAVALLCVYGGIKEVYAVVVSRRALEVFSCYKIRCDWNKIVENILDEKRVDLCPFEKAALTFSDPKKAYLAFTRLRDSFKDCRY